MTAWKKCVCRHAKASPFPSRCGGEVLVCPSAASRLHTPKDSLMTDEIILHLARSSRGKDPHIFTVYIFKFCEIFNFLSSKFCTFWCCACFAVCSSWFRVMLLSHRRAPISSATFARNLFYFFFFLINFFFFFFCMVINFSLPLAKSCAV